MIDRVIFCPDCGAVSRVCDSMKTKDGKVHRIRSCDKCALHWETVEVLVEESDRWTLPRKKKGGAG